MFRADDDPHVLVQAGYRYALALTHHHYDAEDLVQQAWLTGLSQLEGMADGEGA